ncbi:MAG: O-antigen ligase family protein [Alicyclobacillus sp.]|nr:O-antigen ligase family protein [Alicyclobacillus sp.]
MQRQFTLDVCWQLCLTVTVGVVCAIAAVYQNLGTVLELVLVVIAIAIGVVRSAFFRLLYFSIGSVLTFGYISNVSYAKLLFVLGIMVTATMSFTKARRNGIPRRWKSLSPFVVTMPLAMFILSWLVSWQHGTPTSYWFRDVAPYVLFAIAPIVALDGCILPMRSTERIFLIAGLVSTISFITRWGTAHGTFATGATGGLASLSLSASLYIYGLVKFRRPQRSWSRFSWGVLSLLIAACLIISGSRETLIFIVGGPVLLLYYALSTPQEMSLVLVRFIRLLITALVIFTLIFLVTSVLGVNPDWLSSVEARLSTTLPALVNPSSDPSGAERLIEKSLTYQMFAQYPLFGVGPGHVYSWVPPYTRILKSSYVPDSPFSIMSKFGLVGATVLAISFISYIASKLGNYTVQRDVNWTLKIFISLALVWWFLLGPPIEDKGFSVTVCLLLSMLLVREGEDTRLEISPPGETPLEMPTSGGTIVT